MSTIYVQLGVYDYGYYWRLKSLIFIPEWDELGIDEEDYIDYYLLYLILHNFPSSTATELKF